MSIGLIALLDDVAAIAKAAAATLDDVAAQATKAGTKVIGVVIDDAAVTPRYVTGFSASRELPIIGRIALGSLKNKLIVLLPAALALSLFMPGAITPLLMIGGAYLCYEGIEKIYEAIAPHAAHQHEAVIESVDLDARTFEDQKVASAIKTDFILSAEIMAITLGAMADRELIIQAVVLALVGIGITALVYGGVALIVKADDFGLMLARFRGSNPFAMVGRAIGRAFVTGMPYFLKLLGMIGTAAMIWVGGGIIVHGLEGYGFGLFAHVLHEMAHAAAAMLPAIGGVVAWLIEAAGAGFIGILVGFAAIPVMSHAVSPLWRLLKSAIRGLRSGGRQEPPKSKSDTSGEHQS